MLARRPFGRRICNPSVWAATRRATVSEGARVFTYQADVVWESGRRATASSGGREPLTMAPPADFPGGDEASWSPEHLFLASIQACTMLSFLGHCDVRGVGVRTYRSSGHGEVTLRDDGRYAFRRIAMTVMARVDADAVEDARALTAAAERDCFISASTTAAVDTEWRIIA
jgi:organic hydroperoxide reductase OsmC/OhrA